MVVSVLTGNIRSHGANSLFAELMTVNERLGSGQQQDWRQLATWRDFAVARFD